MTSQQTWNSSLSYFYNKINFLLSCEIVLEGCVSDSMTYVK